MNDLISRQAAIETLADMHCKSDEDGYVWIIRSDAWARIDALPSAQSERKKGQWGWTGFNIECPFCEYMPMFDSTEPLYNFCPNCGADMREGEQDGQT